MAVSYRIKTLCSLLEDTDVFADVGCDHGYCTEYMLANEGEWVEVAPVV